MLATSWHRTLRLPMSVTQCSPKRMIATASAGLPLLRPSKGQGYRHATDFLANFTSLSCGFRRFGGRPPEGFSIHPHAVHDYGQLAGDGDSGFLHPAALREAQPPGFQR